jgi:hypothetical protein
MSSILPTCLLSVPHGWLRELTFSLCVIPMYHFLLTCLRHYATWSHDRIATCLSQCNMVSGTHSTQGYLSTTGKKNSRKGRGRESNPQPTKVGRSAQPLHHQLFSDSYTHSRFLKIHTIFYFWPAVLGLSRICSFSTEWANGPTIH